MRGNARERPQLPKVGQKTATREGCACVMEVAQGKGQKLRRSFQSMSDGSEVLSVYDLRLSKSRWMHWCDSSSWSRCCLRAASSDARTTQMPQRLWKHEVCRDLQGSGQTSERHPLLDAR